MFTDLHTLPKGQSMFTLILTGDPAGTPREDLYTEEIDVVAPVRASVEDIIATAKGELADYPADARIVAVADQSRGEMIAVAVDGDLGRGVTKPLNG